MNDERCAHGTFSSEGKPPPRASGTRSELSDGLVPCPLEGYELFVNRFSRLAHLTRNDRDVLAKRLGIRYQ